MADPTKVEVSLGYTVNAGNFESLRVDVRIGDYVRQGETLDGAFDRVYGKSEEKLLEKVTEAKQSFKVG